MRRLSRCGSGVAISVDRDPAVERCTVGGSSINQGRQYMDIVVASSVTAHQGVEARIQRTKEGRSAPLAPGSTATRRSCCAAAAAQRRCPCLYLRYLFSVSRRIRGCAASGQHVRCGGPQGAGAPRRAPPRTVARSGRGSGAGAAAGTEVEVGSRRGGLHSKSGAPRALTTRRAASAERDATRRDGARFSSEASATGRRRERASTYRPGSCG